MTASDGQIVAGMSIKTLRKIRSDTALKHFGLSLTPELKLFQLQSHHFLANVIAFQLRLEIGASSFKVLTETVKEH